MKPSPRVSTAYLTAAEALRENKQQWAAYESKSNCVVLAGPGSGKTKTLTLKLARIMAEDVRAPRGAACITYSQECARELSRRLEGLGLREGPNLFIGTVHGFCMRHLLMPYAKLANLDLPFPLTLATVAQMNTAVRRAGEDLFGLQHPQKALDMGKHRRSVLDRSSSAWSAKPNLARWAERTEAILHAAGVIDFDDLVVQGRKLVTEHDWVLQLVQARFPVLVVDEYQDLGVALHEIVKRLAFDGGVRLFAVGDYDQSVYGFNGADGALLKELSERSDVEPVKLQVNYRSADHLIRASEMVLGEPRGYRSNDPERSAELQFVPRPMGLEDQAAHALSTIVPAALAAKPGRRLGDIAILYKDMNVGNVVAQAASAANRAYIRIDNAAPYKKCALTSWIEDCAAWCAGGWREARPKLRGLVGRWISFHGQNRGEERIRQEAETLTRFLWSHRRDDCPARKFVAALLRELLDPLMAAEPALAEQQDQVRKLYRALDLDGVFASFTTRELGRQDGSPDHLNLLTMHSSKGCEFDVVIMVGLDNGAFPWTNEVGDQLAESRRLFYVGLTRARDAVYLLYSGWTAGKFGPRHDGRSIFVDQLEKELLDL